jgi:peptidoglycan/xylan/chitin deacetylase (PgdA/CDA1 family)
LRSAILTYHSLDDSGSVISISPASFREQMGFLARSGIPVVPLEDIATAQESIALTFDDGFQNFIQDAFPVLEEHGFPATVFVVSGYCGGRNNWPGQRAGVAPDLPLLSWDELSALPPSISIGAHTATHANLRHLPAASREAELRECRDEIEQRLGRRVRTLAYPYGASSPEVREAAGKYFELAVGTSLRFLSARSNRLDLPRLDAYYFRGRFPLERLFSKTGGAYVGMRNILREVRESVSSSS